MKVLFEHDYQKKLMTQVFEAPVELALPRDVLGWRSQWTQALGSWHSPYKLLVDATNLTIQDTPEVRKALETMVKFFQGFYLRQVVGYGFDAAKGHAALPFTTLPTEEEAAIELGVRVPAKREPTDFRSTIQLQNHFQTHTVELNFAEPVKIETKEQVATLRSKLTNNLMQWHSKWSLMIDCTNLEISPDVDEEFDKMWKVLKGFFMKQVIGYSPKAARDSYPFDVYRARHKAAAFIEGEGNFSGDKADCKSRRKA